MKLISNDKTDQALYQAYLKLAEEMSSYMTKEEVKSFKKNFLPDPLIAKSYATLPGETYKKEVMSEWIDSAHYLTSDAASYFSTGKNDLLTQEAIGQIYKELVSQGYSGRWVVSSEPVTLAYGAAPYGSLPPKDENLAIFQGGPFVDCQFCYHRYNSRQNRNCPKCGAVNPNRKEEHERQQPKQARPD